MAAEPLRHYFAPLEPKRRPDACRCGRPSADPVHLEPGDDDAHFAAIEAATAGVHPEELDLDRAPAVRARRRARGASPSG